MILLENVSKGFISKGWGFIHNRDRETFLNFNATSVYVSYRAVFISCPNHVPMALWLFGTEMSWLPTATVDYHTNKSSPLAPTPPGLP